jgi:glycine cleavage system protein P-like pyridoxal-binding family
MKLHETKCLEHCGTDPFQDEGTAVTVKHEWTPFLPKRWFLPHYGQAQHGRPTMKEFGRALALSHVKEKLTALRFEHP